MDILLYFHNQMDLFVIDCALILSHLVRSFDFPSRESSDSLDLLQYAVRGTLVNFCIWVYR
jgi:hypothetical protein